MLRFVWISNQRNKIQILIHVYNMYIKKHLTMKSCHK